VAKIPTPEIPRENLPDREPRAAEISQASPKNSVENLVKRLDKIKGATSAIEAKNSHDVATLKVAKEAIDRRFALAKEIQGSLAA